MKLLNTEGRAATVLTSTLWRGGHTPLDWIVLGLGLCWVQIRALSVLAVWDSEQVTWLSVWVEEMGAKMTITHIESQ